MWYLRVDILEVDRKEQALRLVKLINGCLSRNRKRHLLYTYKCMRNAKLVFL